MLFNDSINDLEVNIKSQLITFVDSTETGVTINDDMGRIVIQHNLACLVVWTNAKNKF